MTVADRVAARWRVRSLLVVISAPLWFADAHAQADAAGDAAPVEGASAFSFAVLGTAIEDDDRKARSLLRAIDGSASRFVVHFDLSAATAAACSDAAMDRRRDLLETSGKPAVPVAGAAEWADCRAAGDPLDRLERIGDTFFGGDQSLGQARLQWLRQSAVPRFRRYRENLRWQVGRVLFVTLNLPDNNNNFRIAAGRNGEFEERMLANRAWVERSFRLATERRLAGIVVFVDAAPRFATPMHVPDSRSRERDGYYELKLGLREFAPRFAGQILLVQAHAGRSGDSSSDSRPIEVDRPLLDANGRVVANFSRVALGPVAGDLRWLRIDVEPREPRLFRVAIERLFDDPSGELYGMTRGR